MKLFKHVLNHLILLPTIIITACSNSTNKKNHAKLKSSITVNIEAEPATLDSRKARLLTDFNLIRTFNDGLFRIDKNGVTQKAVAKSYTLTDGNKRYEIELKETFWSNGDAVTSHDFTYAWRSLLEKDFPSPNASFLFSIKNAKAIKRGLLSSSHLGAYADGDYKIIIELETPVPFFIEFLSLPIYFPINRHVDKLTQNWAISPDAYVCNGPFTFTSWEHRNKITASKNDLYWDKEKVKLDSITMLMLDENTAYNLFKKGSLHHVGSPFSNIPTDALPVHIADGTVKRNPFLGTYWIRTNTTNYPLSNKNLRKALACSIDRGGIAEHIFPGSIKVATGIVPRSMGLQEKPYFNDADHASAKVHFKHALKSMNTKKSDLPLITLSYISTAVNHKIVAAIQDGWRETLGIAIELEPLEYKVFFDRIGKGMFELAYSGKIADVNDPINFLEVFKNKHIGTNNTGWEHVDYISALEESYKTNDKNLRKQLLIKAEKLIMDDMPVIPMHHLAMTHLQDDHLKDLVLTSTGIIDFKYAYLEK